MIDFDLTEEQRMLRQMAHDFAANEIAPVAEKYDREAKFPEPVIKKAQEAGLINVNVPEEYGGVGASLLEECLIAEELCWGCSGIATNILVNNLAAYPIILAGNDEQKREWLGRLVNDGVMASYAVTEPGAGSDVVAIRTSAKRVGDEYVLNGTKTFISNATVANFYVVFAVTDPEKRHKGLSAFIVDRDTPGLKVGKKLEKLGQRAADTAEVVLEDVRVPVANLLGNEGDGFLIAMRVFDHSRPVVAASAVGVARRAMEEAIRYAAERQAFGVPIWRHQAIGHKIADMAISIEAARMLAWRAAWLVDKGTPNTMLASMAKAFAADTAMQITVDAVQVFGGYGYSSEYPVEKLLRDCKVYQIYEGTSEIQRNVIVRELFRPYRKK